MIQFKNLSVEEVIEVHDNIIKTSGGFPGLSVNKSLESALNRAATYSFYENISDLFEIAAIYCISIAQGHLFNDGNKRTAFSTMYNFLQINGYNFNADSHDIVETMLKIAEKKLIISDVAQWIKKYSLSKTEN